MTNKIHQSPGAALVSGCLSAIGRAIVLEEAGSAVYAGLWKYIDTESLRKEKKKNIQPPIMALAAAGRNMAETLRGIPPRRVALYLLRLLGQKTMSVRRLVSQDKLFYHIFDALSNRLRDTIAVSELAAYGQEGS